MLEAQRMFFFKKMSLQIFCNQNGIFLSYILEKRFKRGKGGGASPIQKMSLQIYVSKAYLQISAKKRNEEFQLPAILERFCFHYFNISIFQISPQKQISEIFNFQKRVPGQFGTVGGQFGIAV